MKIPEKLVEQVFERSGPCNEAIRSAYAQWAKRNGFVPYGLPGIWWRETDGKIEILRILPKSGAEVIRYEK